MSNEETCRVCHGVQSDHGPGKTRHAFATKDGELKTHEEVDKEKARPRSMMPAPSHPTMLDRLIEVLLLKGVLTRDEVLYIVMGVSPLPLVEQPDGSVRIG